MLGGVDAASLGEDLLGDLLVAAGGAVARHGGELAAVDGDHPDLDQTGPGAEAQDLAEEIGDGPLVADAEAGDRGVIGRLVGGDHPEGDVLPAAALDATRGALANAIGVGEQGQHHLGVVGCPAVAVGAIGGVEGVEVELLDRLDHEPGQVALVEPVAKVWWQQHRLVTVGAEEVVGHDPIFLLQTDRKAGVAREPPR